MLRRYAKKALRHLQANDFRPLNRILLDHARLLSNIAAIKQQHPGFEVIPVLKGNAYGHGLTEVTEILRQARSRFIAVDGYFEAAKIRDIAKQRILVMGYILPENARLLDTKHCSFVVQDIAGLHAFGRLNKPVRIHLELNTGMNRLGLQANELTDYLKILASYHKLTLEGVMTHLADADNELDETFTQKQVQTFEREVSRIQDAGFHPKLIHIAQTAGSSKVRSPSANAIRLGIGTYGINPLSSKDPHFVELAGLQPVLELQSTVIKIINLQKGDKVSYNGTFTATAPMRIGVLPLGYYEGIPRQLSNKGCVTYRNKTLPIVGKVCMNHTMIDLSGTDINVGDVVTVISKNPEDPNSVAALEALGQFSYTTLTGLSSTVRREIV